MVISFKKRVLLSDLKNFVGEKVVIAGWVHETRLLGGINFVVLKDRSGFTQIVVPKKKCSENIVKLTEDLTKESVIAVEGIVKSSEKSKYGFEVIPDQIELISKARAPTPIDTSGFIKSDLSVRLNYRFLDLRDKKRRDIFRLREAIYFACNYFFEENGFQNIQTPKITALGVESGAELFEIKYFNKKAFLSQSPQVYKQMMVAAGFEKVFEIGPVFRAEKSMTARHLAEFTGIDFEQGFVDGMQDPMNTVELLLKHVCKHLKKNNKEELEEFNKEFLVPKKFPVLTMREAKSVLKEKGKVLPENEDLDPESERMLGAYARKEFDSEFLWVTLYPWEQRPFYHMKSEEDESVTLSYDLLWNGLEVGTGSQREHRYDILRKQAKEKGLELNKMKEYSEIFLYGCPPHGGCGLGLDRFVESLLGLQNIREGILLPRDPERLKP